MKARPDAVEEAIFTAPFDTVLAALEILFNVSLPIWPDKRQSWKLVFALKRTHESLNVRRVFVRNARSANARRARRRSGASVRGSSRSARWPRRRSRRSVGRRPCAGCAASVPALAHPLPAQVRF